MAVTKQEAQIQIKALTHEIAGYENAINIKQGRMEQAKARGDAKEVVFLEGEIEQANRAILAAKGQLVYYGGSAGTRQQKRSQTR
jgi:hypothetical protein